MVWSIYGQWWKVEEFYMRRKAAVFIRLRLASHISNWKTKISIIVADAAEQPMALNTKRYMYGIHALASTCTSKGAPA